MNQSPLLLRDVLLMAKAIGIDPDETLPYTEWMISLCDAVIALKEPPLAHYEALKIDDVEGARDRMAAYEEWAAKTDSLDDEPDVDHEESLRLKRADGKLKAAKDAALKVKALFSTRPTGS